MKSNHTSIKHYGFTLLEVMVALVIFSIGLIGLAGLQGLSMQNNQVAYSRTIATQLAYDMADRIRNNSLGNYAGGIPGAAPTACITSGSPCGSAAMVQHDLWEWSQTVQDPNSSLVSPEMFITATATGYTIAIGWDENRLGISGFDCTLTPPTPAGAECVRINVDP